MRRSVSLTLAAAAFFAATAVHAGDLSIEGIKEAGSAALRTPELDVLKLNAAEIETTASGPADVTCKAKSVMAEAELTVTLKTAPDGSKSLTVSGPQGSQSLPVIREAEMAMDRVEEFLACDPEKEGDCMEKFYPREKFDFYQLSIPGILGLIKTYERLGAPMTYSFDITKPRSGRMYHVQKPTKFGPIGLIEYFDEKGALLGRILAMVEAADCR